jgi:HPt (histidine-containing phosphotransfer) domain-containing protein
MNGFRADNRDTVEKIKRAFAGQDWGKIVELAHGLKGSAANIGASDLSAAAQALEAACREDNAPDMASPGLATLLDQVESELNRVSESIASLAASAPSPTAEPVLAESDLKLDALMAKLAAAVDRADPQDVLTYLPMVKEQVAANQKVDPLSIQTLETQINRYDYDQAMQTIRKICETGQIDL